MKKLTKEVREAIVAIHLIEIEQEACYGTLLIWRIKRNYKMDIGISKSFLCNTMFPMYKAFFKLKHAGITVIT